MLDFKVIYHIEKPKLFQKKVFLLIYSLQITVRAINVD